MISASAGKWRIGGEKLIGCHGELAELGYLRVAVEG